MKKLFLLFSSILLIFTCINIQSIFKLNLTTNNNQKTHIREKRHFKSFDFIKKWHFKPIHITKQEKIDGWVYFAIDNINLSSMGINCIDRLHKYSFIEIPGLKIKYNNILILSRDIWKAKKRTLKQEIWYSMFDNKIFKNTDGMRLKTNAPLSKNRYLRVLIRSIKVTLESAATLWYTNAGELMMRLAYRIWINPFSTDRTFSFETGNFIRIY